MNVQHAVNELLGRILGLEKSRSVEDYHFSFAANWAHRAPFWVIAGCVALAALAIVFYFQRQATRHKKTRVAMAVFRAVALCTVLLLLAEPELSARVSSLKRPVLWLLFDGTDSMAIQDELPAAERNEIDNVVHVTAPPVEASPGTAANPAASTAPPPSRMDFVKALLTQKEGNIFTRLNEKFRLQAFVFEGPQGVRSVELSEAGKTKFDGDLLAKQLAANGKVTALGAAFADLSRRHATSNLGGVLVMSDFNQNAGPPAIESARRLGVEIHTLGFGAATAADVGVEIHAPAKAKKDERASIEVTVQQQGFDAQQVHLRVYAEPIAGPGGNAAARVSIGEKNLTLEGRRQTVEFPYVPDKAGNFDLVAEVDPLPGEIVRENNRAQRRITVLDDFLRLLYVEYEPTWEWRFIKEVFHRDELVGIQGFRTYLHSSDPRVRGPNQLFLASMTTTRANFFAHDVIFLGDLPSTALSPRFCEMVKEFVGDFGGGLVVLAGPRFGPGQLAETPIADMLPVKVDPGSQIDDHQPFAMKLTSMAPQFEFMQLGASQEEAQKAWDGIGELPWFQPVKRVHPQATVLAEHPTQTCSDGKQKQPLIAIRPYGRGEVIYLGFNETWRLRRQFGEKYYRQFWGQMIQRLSLSHALGNRKRFVVRTDRRHYQTDETVNLTVEAYDANFMPLDEAHLPEKKLHGELILPQDGNPAAKSATANPISNDVQTISLTQLKPGVFTGKTTVFTAGEHRIRVIDPISNEAEGASFQVVGTPVERQRAVRDVELQRTLAAETGGKSFDLKDIQRMPDEIRPAAKSETNVEVVNLAHTWFSFIIVVSLLLGEWLMRKLVNLP